MKLTKNKFFESLKWHQGIPPTDEDKKWNQFGTTYLYHPKVVALKDNDGNNYLVGDFNKNLCVEVCKGCLNEKSNIVIPCIGKSEISEWAEFYSEEEFHNCPISLISKELIETKQMPPPRYGICDQFKNKRKRENGNEE